MALIAMLMGTPFNAGAQTIIPKSRFSARNVPPQVKEHNLFAMCCTRCYSYSYHGRSWVGVDRGMVG